MIISLTHVLLTDANKSNIFQRPVKYKATSTRSSAPTATPRRAPWRLNNNSNGNNNNDNNDNGNSNVATDHNANNSSIVLIIKIIIAVAENTPRRGRWRLLVGCCLA